MRFNYALTHTCFRYARCVKPGWESTLYTLLSHYKPQCIFYFLWSNLNFTLLLATVTLIFIVHTPNCIKMILKLSLLWRCAYIPSKSKHCLPIAKCLWFCFFPMRINWKNWTPEADYYVALLSPRNSIQTLESAWTLLAMKMSCWNFGQFFNSAFSKSL